MKFLTEAVERGAHDDLRTPAGSIVTGKPALIGSGMCRILPKIELGRSRRKPLSTIEEEPEIRGKLPPSKEAALRSHVKLEETADGDDEGKESTKKRKPATDEKRHRKKTKFHFG